MPADALAATQSLGIKSPNGEATIAYDMNARGQVAAVLEDDEGRQRGVLYEQGKVTELRSLGGGYSDAKAINEQGQVVGSAQGADRRWKAFVFRARQRHARAGHPGRREQLRPGDQPARRCGRLFRHARRLLSRLRRPAGTAHAGSGHAGRHHQLRERHEQHGAGGGHRLHARRIPPRFPVRPGARHGRSGHAGRPVQLRLRHQRQPRRDRGRIADHDRRWHAFMHDGKRMIDLGAIIGHGSSFATGINNA
ncbi:hypothetical protein LP420_32585 [Massilia sp. B-10]|nr:hypothetical protein LP420_32585 [Massilia sp. B-10]